MPEIDLALLLPAIETYIPMGRSGLLPALHAAQKIYGSGGNLLNAVRDAPAMRRPRPAHPRALDARRAHPTTVGGQRVGHCC